MIRTVTKILRLFAIALLLMVTPTARSEATDQSFLDQLLTTARTKHQLPAVAALIQNDGKIVAESAQGFRAIGHPEAVTINDRWHIGSDTKAITATMIARLVEQKIMAFDETLEQSFPALAKEMDPAYRKVTITQLLSHTAGLPPLTDDKDLPEFIAIINAAKGMEAQRAAIARAYLSKPPASKPGEFVYSNLGFIIAGTIAEAKAGKPWEDLIRELIFAPLGITNAGFGPPGTSSKFDQPQGHRDDHGKFIPFDPSSTDADNPPALGPAGTVNIGLREWMKFATDQLDGIHGHGKLLKPETYRKLHTPVTGNYALGWGARLSADGVPVLITHSGSNGHWLADIRIMPQHDMIFLVVSNAGNEGADKAFQEIGAALRERYKPFE